MTMILDVIFDLGGGFLSDPIPTRPFLLVFEWSVRFWSMDEVDRWNRNTRMVTVETKIVEVETANGFNKQIELQYQGAISSCSIITIGLTLRTPIVYDTIIDLTALRTLTIPAPKELIRKDLRVMLMLTYNHHRFLSFFMVLNSRSISR